ncbi:N5-glutamine methyltransferase family protein [Tistrella bauzanensis]
MVVSDWASCLAATGCEAGAFDLILSNPPYIPSGEIRTLDPEVARHEPHLALDGGDDGLAAYRVLAPGIARLLRPDGFACIEIGLGQALDVERLLADQGLMTSVRNDLGHIARCVTARHAMSPAA